LPCGVGRKTSHCELVAQGLLMAKLKENTLLQSGAAALLPARIIIDQIIPSIENGRFAAKCTQSMPFPVEAVIISDSLESIKADLLWRHENDLTFTRTPMTVIDDDRYAAVIRPTQTGRYVYTVEASIDRFTAWKNSFLTNLEAGTVTQLECNYGSRLMQEFADHPGHTAQDQHRTLKLVEEFTELCTNLPFLTAIEIEKIGSLLNTSDLYGLMRSVWDDPATVQFTAELPLTVDPPHAMFSASFEFPAGGTPKSLSDIPGRLTALAGMGFDIIYLPIWPEGGLSKIDPDCGSAEDLSALVKMAKSLDIKLALDIAFDEESQKPWVDEHPEWFYGHEDNWEEKRDDSSMDFETKDWRALWDELRQAILFWVKKDIRIFRVKNPHAKSFAFWEWCIREISKDYPDVVFIADAITRPYVMAYLAKIGFNQSYTYFNWLQSKPEITQYMEELTGTELQYYFRPTFWARTPDFSRLMLAALLCPNYGIYGLPTSSPLRQPELPASLIRKINFIRKENPAFHSNSSLLFHNVNNENLIAWTKQEGSNLVLIVINLDPNKTQSGTIDLQLDKLEVDESRLLMMTELLSGHEHEWQGRRNEITLSPQTSSALIFRIEHP